MSDWRLSAYSLILFSLLLIVLSTIGRGDDLTGMVQDDPKDLMPYSPPPAAPPGALLFAPLPIWAHVDLMTTLPYQLKPMGKKPVVAATPAPPPLAPPRESTAQALAPPTDVMAKPAPANPSPALVAVSPFLQWIKANPQAAAAEARRQADSYHAPSTPAPGAPGTANGGNDGNGPGANGTPEDPFWLPPLIDSPDIGARPVTGSAAIYETPQR